MSSGKLNASAPAPRAYQKNIAGAVLEKGSSLVVLPTGMGKTLVALLVAQEKLAQGRVLFLAPTRPLAAQHEKTVREWMDLEKEEVLLVSGLIPAKKRAALYLTPARFILSTPQTIANDLQHGRLEWKGFSLVVFDEVHRAVGKYAYTVVAAATRGAPIPMPDGTSKPLADNAPTLTLGLTASPGGDRKRIEEIVSTLGVKHVQIRTAEDADVAPYVQPLSIEWVSVSLSPELAGFKATLEKLIGAQVATLRKMGFVGQFNSKKGLSEWRARILQSGSQLRWSALSHHATLFSLVHVLELLETQGVESVRRFVARVKEREPSKAQQRLLRTKEFMDLVQQLETAVEHPKLQKLLEIVKGLPAGQKVIVFCQYRDQVGVLVDTLAKAGLKAQSFMGKKDGVTAAGQAQTIADFREGKFDVLVATSIGEEGLDIPSVDTVIFYEPVPSEIRAIQRRGRAGRAKMGRVIGLMTAGTKDQFSFWAAKKKEDKMRTVVGRMSAMGVGGFGKKAAKKADEKKEDAQAPQKKEKEKSDAAQAGKQGQLRLGDF
ncbi:MAG: DEAD/DEAH box helicase [Candidatus Micrarchaeota archaeon]|nr:DEAD/DEAH box helicase [Candidatus Micrarchaeota archaeon]